MARTRCPCQGVRGNHERDPIVNDVTTRSGFGMRGRFCTSYTSCLHMVHMVACPMALATGQKRLADTNILCCREIHVPQWACSPSRASSSTRSRSHLRCDTTSYVLQLAPCTDCSHPHQTSFPYLNELVTGWYAYFQCVQGRGCLWVWPQGSQVVQWAGQHVVSSRGQSSGCINRHRAGDAWAHTNHSLMMKVNRSP